MKVAAHVAGVARLPDRPHPLAGPDSLTAMNDRRPNHVGVEVAAVLALAVDQQVVAVEDRVIAPAQDAAGHRRDKRRTAAGDDVEALMGAASAARRSEFADRAARAVRPVDREHVAIEGESTIAHRAPGARRARR
jgi:hypothetical protein